MRNIRTKKQTVFFLLAAFLLAEACNFSPENLLVFIPRKIVSITEVTVSPPAAPLNFTLSVSYHREQTGPVSISCYFIGPDGATRGIMTIDDDGKSGFLDVTRTREFTVAPLGGKPPAGLYTATCADEDNTTSMSAFFNVSDEPEGDVVVMDVKVAETQKYSYALSFMYRINIPEPVSFTCNYTSPAGSTVHIGNYTDDHHLYEPKVRSMGFTVQQADGKVLPGLYTVTCQENEGRSKKTTTFVVVEEATATVEATAQQTATAKTVTINGAGMHTYVDGNKNQTNCTVPAVFSLTTTADGSARIEITTRSIDYVISPDGSTQCYWKSGDVVYKVDGKTDSANKAVIFDGTDKWSCRGKVSYAGGALAGEFLCSGGFASPEFGHKFTAP